jgi:hypothetical protein
MNILHDPLTRESAAGSHALHTPAGSAARAAQEQALECPLHAAMRHLAEAAVLQHVLYAEGECLPRPELLQEVNGWADLHDLIRAHVCPATREAPLEAAELDLFVRDALAFPTTAMPQATQASLQAMVLRCAACRPSDSCPLDYLGDERLLGDD